MTIQINELYGESSSVVPLVCSLAQERHAEQLAPTLLRTLEAKTRTGIVAACCPHSHMMTMTSMRMTRIMKIMTVATLMKKMHTNDEEHGGGEDHAEHAAEHARAGADSVLDEHSLESLASGNTPGALKALLAYAHVCLACFTVAASAGLQHSTQQRRFGQDHVDAETWGARCLAAI